MAGAVKRRPAVTFLEFVSWVTAVVNFACILVNVRAHRKLLRLEADAVAKSRLLDTAIDFLKALKDRHEPPRPSP